MPKTFKEAAKLDAKNGDTKGMDAILKEMTNVRVAFDILKDGDRAPIGHKQINCHLIYDIKMEDFRHKALLVAGGHMTENPKCMTYSSIVRRETVGIALTVSGLNNLQVKAGDVMNAYLTAPCSEKDMDCPRKRVWNRPRKESYNSARTYGLKSSGAAFHAHLADCMRSMEYTPCRGDNDLWIKPEIDPD